ncbi:N-glycosylase/DNA lyase [Cordyceps militaris CM01]|uniref:DNA-(apurinic or apyrimidinic site) lyase n=1 Tax=Cordyceps militaris (strain CM01) TaxID=983644 RepID=G3J8M8_CORMM|nr:N-glycosylase/DNA lyase [Cordyceps militaris CM01]EGX93963.1 N-glycosylase/DNA lyase [Cordyceps militaris CM01]
MAMKRAADWQKLPVTLAELCIDTTLRCGQSFRWRKINDEWYSRRLGRFEVVLTCALHGRILSLKQDSQHLHYQTTWPSFRSELAARSVSIAEDDTEDLLRHYFSLRLNLAELYQQWSRADPNFAKKAPEFAGVRILSQDAWEALVHKLCIHYGPLLGHVGDDPIHDFPTPESLSGPNVESHLRELGFGYRAKYIAQTARVIAKEKPAGWLETLRNPESVMKTSVKAAAGKSPTYKAAHEELLALTGVGPKVADCVCLMGLGWGESVPVDTHVWQIAQRDYKMGKTKTKTFNKAMYDAVGDHFRGIWGSYAGWAHSVLFTADLKSFADRPPKLETVLNGQVSPEEEKPGKTTKKRVRTEKVVDVKSEQADAYMLDMELPAKRRRTRRRP